MKVMGAILATAGALIATAAGPALSLDLELGKSLHDNHCRMCHDSIACSRGKRIAHSYAEIKVQVTRWQTNTGLRWDADDIDNVTAYVAQTYYQLPAPEGQ